jgi:hypothetical protein
VLGASPKWVILDVFGAVLGIANFLALRESGFQSPRRGMIARSSLAENIAARAGSSPTCYRKNVRDCGAAKEKYRNGR